MDPESKSELSQQPEIDDAAAAKKREANRKKREKAKAKKQANATADPEVAKLVSSFDSLGMRAFFKEPTQLACSALKGRHVVAVQPIPAGTVVFESAPVCAVINDTYAHAFCLNCFQTAPAMLQCSGCKVARFCSARCKLEQTKLHEIECLSWRRIENDIAVPEKSSLRAVARLLAAKRLEEVKSAVNEEKSKNFSGSSKRALATWKPVPELAWSSVQALMTNESHLDAQSRLDALTLMAKLREAVEPWMWVSDVHALSLYLALHSNAHAISSPEGIPIGVGLYLPSAMMSHSCLPSCSYTFIEGRLVMRATVDLQPGDELTFAYCNMLMTPQARGEFLQRHFFIDSCKCSLFFFLSPSPPNFESLISLQCAVIHLLLLLR